MAVTATLLTTGSSPTDGTTFNTATITPTPGRLILAAVYTTVGSGTSSTTASGCGLNWALVDKTSAAGRQMSVFRAMGPSTTAGPITFTANVTLSSALWQVVEFNGADTSGVDGSGAIAQSVNDRPGTVTSVRAPFPLPVDPANIAYAVIGNNAASAPAVGGAPWTLLASTTSTSPSSGFTGELSSPPAQDVTASSSTAASTHAVGVEIKAATGVTVPTGAASGSWGFTGTAVGVRQPRGTAAGSWSFAGVARGGSAPVGRAVGSWSFTGAAVGVSDRSGTAAGSWGFTGAAAGTVPMAGSASGAWGFAGEAVGRTPVVVGISHTYGYATLVSATVGVATLATALPGIATLVATTAGGFGVDFGLSFGAPSPTGAANGVSAATITYAPGLAALQTDS